MEYLPLIFSLLLFCGCMSPDCGSMVDPADRFRCLTGSDHFSVSIYDISAVALAEEDPALCELIPVYELYEYSFCVSDIAVRTENISLCERASRAGGRTYLEECRMRFVYAGLAGAEVCGNLSLYREECFSFLVNSSKQ